MFMVKGNSNRWVDQSPDAEIKQYADTNLFITKSRKTKISLNQYVDLGSSLTSEL